MQTASCFLESLYEGIDFAAGLSRPRLESLITPFLPQLGDLLHHALAKANLNPADIDTVGDILKPYRFNIWFISLKAFSIQCLVCEIKLFIISVDEKRGHDGEQ